MGMWAVHKQAAWGLVTVVHWLFVCQVVHCCVHSRSRLGVSRGMRENVGTLFRTAAAGTIYYNPYATHDARTIYLVDRSSPPLQAIAAPQCPAVERVRARAAESRFYQNSKL